MTRISRTFAVTLCSLVLAGGAAAQEGAALQLPPEETPTLTPAEPMPPSDGSTPTPSAVPLASPVPPTAAAPLSQPAPQALSGGAPETPAQPLVIDPTQRNPLAYFSPRLGARFLIQPMFLPQFGHFYGARLVSMPEPGSPLLQLGLSEGDVITRLDGWPVMDTWELERHIFETSVRYIRAGEQVVRRGTMDICPHEFFRDRYAASCEPFGCGRIVLRP
jgi:hypothetical protein